MLKREGARFQGRVSIGCFALFVSTLAQAATYTVTNSNDSGSGSLRDVLASIPAGAGGGTIRFQLPAHNRTIWLTSGPLHIDRSIAIDGGIKGVILHANRLSHVLDVAVDKTVTLARLTVTGGFIGSGKIGGAGIRNYGRLTLNRVEVRNNLIQTGNLMDLGAGGAGILNAQGAWLSISGSTIEDNASGTQATNHGGSGGGIYNAGSLMIQSSSLINNSTSCYLCYGGAIANTGTATILNATIANNSAQGFYGMGGGIHNSGSLSLAYSTFKGNDSVDTGNAIFSSTRGGGGPSQLTLTHTVIDQIPESMGGPACAVRSGALLTDQGYNFVSDGTCITASTSQKGDPKLGMLSDTGGGMLTITPQADSPLINGGQANCQAKWDQRGKPRAVGGRCDIGAVEVQLFNQ